MAADSPVNRFLNQLKTFKPVANAVQKIPTPIRSTLRRALDSSTRQGPQPRILANVSQTNDLLARLMYEQALTTPRYQDPKRLLGSGFKVYSQHDEDGIIDEIFCRIGVTNRRFVEFGVGDGLENCTLYLLLQGWSGYWIDGSAHCYEEAQRLFKFLMDRAQLRLLYSFVTAENIESLFQSMGVPQELDFLSIDIDGNDFWLWKAIRNYNPRVVAIEYNASLRSTVSCTTPYKSTFIGDGTNFYGASLKALELLGREKGYSLVSCNYTGVNAFFVRNDLVGDHFAEPFTAENHYEPPRYFVRMPNGHQPGFGPFVNVGPEEVR